MKILVFDFSGNEPTAHLYPDSALVRTDRPVFLPDALAPLDWRGAVVARVSRQGKSVPERFAHRYWDAASVGVVTCPVQEAGNPLLRCFDGAVACGEWLDMSSDDARRGLTARVSDGSQWRPLLLGLEACQAADRAVALASRLMTLKTGDMLMVADSVRVPAHPGLTLGGSLDGHEVLTIRLK